MFLITYLYVRSYFIFICLLFGIILWGPKSLEKAQIRGPFSIQVQADFQPNYRPEPKPGIGQIQRLQIRQAKSSKDQRLKPHTPTGQLAYSPAQVAWPFQSAPTWEQARRHCMQLWAAIRAVALRPDRWPTTRPFTDSATPTFNRPTLISVPCIACIENTQAAWPCLGSP